MSLFAELFNEMLIRDFGFSIYKSLVVAPEKKEEEKKDKKESSKDKDKDHKEKKKDDDKRDDKRMIRGTKRIGKILKDKDGVS